MLPLLDKTHPLWSRDTVLKAVSGGGYGPDWSATNVSIDSREVTPGDLFIALHGETVDGHNYLKDACHRGAASILIDHWPSEIQPESLSISAVMVRDTLQALWDLGKDRRQKICAKIAAITGSVGKTTTKDALSHILRSQALTAASEKSLNTKVGVPLSLARCPEDAVFGVFEIGMSLPGEIAPLAKLVSPDVVMITMIAPAHLASMKSLESIAVEKCSIVEGLSSDGIVILNHDMPLFEDIRARLSNRIIWTYGQHEKADLRLISNHLIDHQTQDITAHFRGESASFSYGVRAIGIHMAMNTLAALLAAKALGANVWKAIHDLNTFEPALRRGQIEHVLLSGGGEIILLDESYNANPTSMRTALQSLAALKKLHQGRALAVMGDMLELGENSENYHRDLSNDIKNLQIDSVYTCGPLMQNLAADLNTNIHRFHHDSAEKIAQAILKEIRAGDIIMVKGSRGMGMEKVIELLKTTIRVD